MSFVSPVWVIPLFVDQLLFPFRNGDFLLPLVVHLPAAHGLGLGLLGGLLGQHLALPRRDFGAGRIDLRDLCRDVKNSFQSRLELLQHSSPTLCKKLSVWSQVLPLDNSFVLGSARSGSTKWIHFLARRDRATGSTYL